jgi:nucleotide-binding universal stress UspA family protein
MKILVYVDPSPCGEWAWPPALDLTRTLAREVILLTTSENLEAHPELLDEAAARFEGGKDLVIEKKSRPGPPRRAILEESRESSPAITVFPPAGRRRLTRMIHGSRVKAVLQSSPSTVMVARKPVSDHIRRILVTVSGGPFSETTLLSAVEIAQAVQGDVTVLHVTSGVSIPYGEGGEEDTAAPQAGPQKTPVDALIEKLSGEGIALRVRRREGMVVREILSEVEEGHYDLLVLGQHLADKASGGPLTEDISEILALECPIPVLVVRPRRWAAASRG